MKIFEMTRTYISRETIRVEASSAFEAKQLAEEDDDCVEVLTDEMGDYEVDYSSIYEVVEP